MAEKQNTPEIRFEGFTDPWEQRKLGELADRYKELVPTPRNGYVRMGVRSHAKGTFLAEVEPGQQIEEQELSRVKADNLVVNIVFAWEHAVAITSADDTKALVSHRFPQFSFHDDMEPGFFRYAILDEAFRWHLWLASPSGAGRNKTLNVGAMLEYEFSVPKKAEQAKIAAFLDRLDDLITLHQRKHDKLCTVKRSMLDKMFPKPGETEPEIRFKGFTDPWEQRKLREIACEVTRNDPKSDAPVMMITAENGFIEQSKRYAFNNAGQSLNRYTLLRKGELAYNHGASKLRPFGSCFSLSTSDYARIPFVYHCFSVPNHNDEFLSIELNGKVTENQLRQLVSSGARMDGLLNISFEEYSSVSIWLPIKAEQDEIASFFKQLNSLITLHQREPPHMMKEDKNANQYQRRISFL